MHEFKSILVVLDTRLDEHPALDWALPFARRSQAHLTLVDVIPEGVAAALSPEDLDQVHSTKDKALLELARRLRDEGYDVNVKVLTGRSSVEICAEAERSGHDLVVRVPRGRDSSSPGYFGVTTRGLLRNSHCAVCVVGGSGSRVSTVLAAIAPVDGDSLHESLNQTVLKVATELADDTDNPCHIVEAWEVFGASLLRSRGGAIHYDDAADATRARRLKIFRRQLEALGRRFDEKSTHLIEGDPAHIIPELATRISADLIVMGNAARSGFKGWLLGNTSERLLAEVRCSVLALTPGSQ